MKLVIAFDDLDSFGEMENVSQAFRDKMVDQFLADQFPSWTPEFAFGKRDWDFVNSECHIEMPMF